MQHSRRTCGGSGTPAPGPGPRTALDRPGFLAFLLKALTAWEVESLPALFFKDAEIRIEKGTPRFRIPKHHANSETHDFVLSRSLPNYFQIKIQIYDLQKASRPASSACRFGFRLLKSVHPGRQWHPDLPGSNVSSLGGLGEK